MKRKAIIVLEDGSVFNGLSGSLKTTICAEVVFNTAMTGYQEICTDPSYANQMIVFTVSHIGNVGVNEEDHESSHIWVKGIVVKEMSTYVSNWRADRSLIDFLMKHNIPWIEGVDTRKLVRHLQRHGSQNGCLVIGEDTSFSSALYFARYHKKAKGLDLSSIAITSIDKTIFSQTKNAPLICVYDFGVKSSIIKQLESRGYQIKVISSTKCPEEIISLNPFAIVLSNGPGDPSSSINLIKKVKKLVDARIPLLGICFGCQLLGIALGAQTKKMKYGHHGVNHPVLDLRTGQVYITSQNHNFVISRKGFPSSLIITHVSLFDKSIQGIRLKNFPVIGFQGHPEGSPGPYDIKEIFDSFFCELDDVKKLETISCL